MPSNGYSTTWVSHSSIGDFMRCPRAYYLKNVYKDPKTSSKVQIISPALSLGQAVHEVIESLSILPVDKRFSTPLQDKYEEVWEKVSGKKGGFLDKDTEAMFKKRGENMLRRVTRNPGPLLNLAVKIKMDLPSYWLSQEAEIKLCGRIDWLEYIKDEDAVHIIDFKTSKYKEGKDSLQLPIYHLLASNCQPHEVIKASYWYVDQSDNPENQKLPNLEKSHDKILKIAKKIKLARQLESFNCPNKSGCSTCKPYESILAGEGELVGKGNYGSDVYILEKSIDDDDIQTEIL